MSSKIRLAAEKIDSLQTLAALKKDGALSEEEFLMLKSEILGTETNNIPEYDGNDMAEFTESLFRMDENGGVPEAAKQPAHGSAAPEQSKLTADIDFSIDPDDVIIFPEEKKKNPAGELLAEAERKFISYKEKYSERDCALMDAEALSELSVPPLFLMGAAAAVMFYLVLVTFAEMEEGLSGFIIQLCIWAGMMPAAIIIPNAVKYSRKNKTAKEANRILEDNYNRSGITEIPFEYTSPYVLSELESIIASGKADGIRSAVESLGKKLSAGENLAAEKKKADFSENDELAARSAALYVAGKGLIYEIE